MKGDKIYAETTLDREKIEQYQLLIQASDLGQPALSSQRQIAIIITDQNDNAPRWVGVRAGTVDASSQNVNKPIAQMRAVDVDAGLNGSVGYRLTRGIVFVKFEALHSSDSNILRWNVSVGMVVTRLS